MLRRFVARHCSWMLVSMTIGCTTGEALWPLPRFQSEKPKTVDLFDDDVAVSERYKAPLKISPKHAKITFVGSSDAASYSCEFKSFRGTFELPGDDPCEGKINVEIDMASVSSGTVMLARFLKSKSAFDVAFFPTASFRSTRIIEATDGKSTHVVTGEFNIHGRTRAIEFPADISVTADSLDFSAEFILQQTDFGLERLVARKTKNNVPVTVKMRLPRRDGLILGPSAGAALPETTGETK